MNTNGLSSESKKAVKSTVLFLRELLEGKFDADTGEPILPGGDITRQIARFGISLNQPESLDSDKSPEYLTEDEKEKRKHICAAIKREVSLFGNISDRKAYKRGMRAFIRQTSYTWINRLLGLKCMEVRGLLKDEHGEPDFVVTVSEDYGGLPRRAWRIKGSNPERWQTAKLYDLQCETILSACKQLTQEIKVLFDPDHAYGLIWPSAPTLNTIIDKIQELDQIDETSPFQAHDFLGWVYQYFQSKEKDLVFKAASKKKRKIEKDDIIPATQIYTEHYMVEYLVQNTLGRFWMEMHPDSKLSENWGYYVKPPKENPSVEREFKKAIDLKLMDPAVGSGHFHLVAFDLLISMYKEEIKNAGQPGWLDTPSVKSDKKIPGAILANNLYGIDIDARAIQIAALVLVMKARESGYDKPITHINLVVANNAPFESETWYKFIQDLKGQKKHSVARVLASLGLQLKNLDEFGSLLRIEDEMRKVIKDEKKQWIAQTKAGKGQKGLFPEFDKPTQRRIPFEKEVTDETFFDRLESFIEKELNVFYLNARQDGVAEEAILVSDTERGFEFFRLILKKFDIVYTNPPYMGSKNMGKELKKFVSKYYSAGKRDLYAAFMLRCHEFATTNGYVGMVTQQTWLFLRSFESLRNNPKIETKKVFDQFPGILRQTCIDTLAHLGPGAFSEISGEVVNSVLIVFRKYHIIESNHFISIMLYDLKPSSKKANALRNLSIKENISRIFKSKQSELLALPLSPVVYWLKDVFLSILSNCDKLKAIASVKQGLATGDDDRFRKWSWEISDRGNRWLPYSKGGGYRKWSGFNCYLVDWENNGLRIKETGSGAVRNERFYKISGLTHGQNTQGCLSVRELKSGSVFGGKGPATHLNDNGNPQNLLPLMNSRLSSYLLRAITCGMDFTEGYVASLPIPLKGVSKNWAEFAQFCIRIKTLINSKDLLEDNFTDYMTYHETAGDLFTLIENKIIEDEKLWVALHTVESFCEKDVFNKFDLGVEESQIVCNETGYPAGWYPLIPGYDSIPGYFKELSFPIEVINDLSSHNRTLFSYDELDYIKSYLRNFYLNRNNNQEPINSDWGYNLDEEDKVEYGVFIPFPYESVFEKLSYNIKIHPISIYWLLKEMREKEKLFYPYELKDRVEDFMSIMILRMLGFQWPKEIEANQPMPDWVDDDGIIPLTEGLGEATLLYRVRKLLGTEFGEEKEAAIESGLANIVGKSLECWLEEDFFPRHLKQFKNRPIAWQLVSDPSAIDQRSGSSGKGKKKRLGKKLKPAFSVLVHYHRFADGENGYGKLLLLKNKYLEKLMSQARYELESLRGKGDDPERFDRIAELDRKLLELEDFRDRLERIQEGKDREARIHVRWKKPDDQARSWQPDINDGVKINIAPWERLGMFPVKKIVGKVEMGSD